MKAIISLFMLIQLLSGMSTSNVDIYSQTYAVVEVDSALDVVTCIDSTGEEWAFDKIVDTKTLRPWKRGDMVSAIMSDNGTPNDIHDDEFITVSFVGEIHGGFGWDEEYQLPLVVFER